MKHLKKFYIKENKEAINKLLDKSKYQIDPSDIEYLKKITKKLLIIYIALLNG